MSEYLDVLQTLTLKGKAFHMSSFEKWKNQLRLIKGCYSGQTGVVSEPLTVGAPDEIIVLCSHSRRSEFPITCTCLLGLCALYWRLAL